MMERYIYGPVAIGVGFLSLTSYHCSPYQHGAGSHNFKILNKCYIFEVVADHFDRVTMLNISLRYC